MQAPGCPQLPPSPPSSQYTTMWSISKPFSPSSTWYLVIQENSFASWNDSIQFCRWPGISCGGRRHPERVVSLNLSSLDLAGFIPPMIANLTFLRKIDLSDNQIHGSIPQEIDRLFRLQHLNLSMNSLDGGIPASLFHCSKLKVIRGIHAPGRNSIQSLQLLRPSNPIFEEQQSNTIHTAFFRKPLISFCSIHGAKQT